jgi:uncharacterized coiled-coil protein SlyX
MLSVPLQDNYIQSRSTAIESIESTIAELGQIFNQLAHMVAEQRETVQRIDADTADIAANVGGAQRELLKYYASISSNRWLMLKVFGVLIVFVRGLLRYLGIATWLKSCIRGSSLSLFWFHDLDSHGGRCSCRYILYPPMHYGHFTRYGPSEQMVCRSCEAHIYEVSMVCKAVQPTGMALTPVPCGLVGRAPLTFFFAFLPPRCVSPSSTSPTVHVRFPVEA